MKTHEMLHLLDGGKLVEAIENTASPMTLTSVWRFSSFQLALVCDVHHAAPVLVAGKLNTSGHRAVQRARGDVEAAALSTGGRPALRARDPNLQVREPHSNIFVSYSWCQRVYPRVTSFLHQSQGTGPETRPGLHVVRGVSQRLCLVPARDVAIFHAKSRRTALCVVCEVSVRTYWMEVSSWRGGSPAVL